MVFDVTGPSSAMQRWLSGPRRGRGMISAWRCCTAVAGGVDDPKPTVLLLGVDLAKREAGPILPEPVPAARAMSHRLRFSPQDSL